MVNTRKKTSKQNRNAAEIVEIDHIISALNEIQQSEEECNEFPDCYSVKEICECIGKGDRATRKMIKQCMSNGTCEYAGRRQSIGIDGRVVWTPVYRFKNKIGKQKKKK